MRIKLEYPVIVEAVPKRGTKTKNVCGMFSEEWPIEDVPVDDMVLAAEIEGHPDIMAFDGKCYVEARRQWSEGEEVEAGMIDADDIRPLGDDLAQAVNTLRRTRAARDVVPPYEAGPYDTPAKRVYGYFRSAGDIRRRVTGVDVEMVERSRRRVVRYMENFKISGGRLYVRCHEPILISVPGEVRLASTSIYSVDVDERERGNTQGLAQRDKIGPNPFLHAFPLDRFDEARAMAVELEENAAVVSSSPPPGIALPAISVHRAMSTTEDVLDREIVRFLRHHMDIMESMKRDPMIQRSWRAYGEDSSKMERLNAYYATGTHLGGLIRGHEYLDGSARQDITDIRAALEATVEAAENIGNWPSSAVYDTYRRVELNIRLMLGRLDVAPIEIASVTRRPN